MENRSEGSAGYTFLVKSQLNRNGFYYASWVSVRLRLYWCQDLTLEELALVYIHYCRQILICRGLGTHLDFSGLEGPYKWLQIP